jgi:hypothetical protein
MFKSKVLWIALGAALLLSLTIGGVVAAQGQFAQGQFADQDNDGQCDMLALGGQMMRGMMGGRGGFAFGQMAEWHETTLVSVAAQQLNLTVEQITAELGADKTLEQVILAHSGNPQAVVDAYVAARKVTLDGLVADGRMTQAQEDQMLVKVAEEATEHLKTAGACSGECDGECTGEGGKNQRQPQSSGGGMMGRGGMGGGMNNVGRGRMARATQG